MTLNAALSLSGLLVTMLQMTLNAPVSLSDTTSDYTSDNDKAALSVIWSWEVQKFLFSSGVSFIVIYMLGKL